MVPVYNRSTRGFCLPFSPLLDRVQGLQAGTLAAGVLSERGVLGHKHGLRSSSSMWVLVPPVGNWPWATQMYCTGAQL